MAACAATPAAAGTPGCSYAPGTKTVTLNAEGPGYILRVTGGGEIFQANTPCGGTVLSTDTIVVNAAHGSYANAGVSLWLHNPFSPGFTNEPGSSDEIEFVVNYTDAGSRYLSLENTNDIGTNPNLVFTVLGGNQINLNAAESDGLDADINVNGMSSGTVEVSVGSFQSGVFLDNFVNATGGQGTPETSFSRPVRLGGAGGVDALTGGGKGDLLLGRDDVDLLAGSGGGDRVRGGAGGDSLSGGGGADDLEGGTGADDIDGGSGKDVCRGGPGQDSLKDCETKIQ